MIDMSHGHRITSSYSAFDEERWAAEPPKSRSRTAFQRDRARLIHSSALRRLGAKSQILVAGSDDFARTRLTHTLEVAQIGRQIAQLLGCDPDVVDCACLAHDLGHPPFGHNGEHALAVLASNIGGFEGNAQTLRLLTRLEPKIEHADGRSAGVNLTRASLDAAVKYPWDYATAIKIVQERGDTIPRDAPRGLKFGVYPDDMPVFQWLKQGAEHPEKKPIEAQAMDLADDIAYSVHDVEDAIAIGAFDPAILNQSRILDAIVEDAREWYGRKWGGDGLVAAFQRLATAQLLPESFDGSRRALANLKNITSALIGRFAESVEHATRDAHGAGPLTRYHADIVTPESIAYEITLLKGIAAHFMMMPRERDDEHLKEQRIVTDLVEAFMSVSPALPSALEPAFRDDWRTASNDDERLRVAIDQVASLTDGSATALHAMLCGAR